jgi:hypothetical protein
LNRDQVSSGLFLVAGCLICAFSLPYKLGTPAAPESGLMPFLSGAAICLLAAIGFGAATLRRLRGERWKAVLRGRALAFVLLLRPLGFLLTTALFIAFLLRAIVPQRWPLVVAVSVLTAAFAYLVFEVWLKAQLPTGLLGI